MLRSVRARPAERTRPLPGDELLPDTMTSLTHAITIRRPPHEVWPWLLQMGAGRAGWYSYDFIDNGRRPSARRIRPELQHTETGDVFPAMPGVTDGFTVLSVDPERSLILGWVSPEGQPITTWAFVLEEPERGSTRLLVRARARAGYRPPFGLPLWTVNNLVQWGHALMQRKQLLGIAQRAEAAAPLRRIMKQATAACCDPGGRN
ncbi:MAG TPA: hypothetical protein VFH24_00910 [Gemmatimonadales bacterium]|nr:hypothetical protein [Gemmatimonadales bacterium]